MKKMIFLGEGAREDAGGAAVTGQLAGPQPQVRQGQGRNYRSAILFLCWSEIGITGRPFYKTLGLTRTRPASQVSHFVPLLAGYRYSKSAIL